nr:hypothetical protein [Sporomusa silvacetica]
MHEARDSGKHINATYGRRTRIVTMLFYQLFSQKQ